MKLSKNKKIFIFASQALLFLTYIYSSLRIISFNNELLITILFLFFTTISFLFFNIQIVQDIKSMEISAIIAYVPIVVLLIFLILIGLMYGFDTKINLWEGNSITVVNNILGGLFGSLIIGLIVFLTKGKGMGEGDIWIFGLVGLFVGLDKLIPSFYIAIFTALFFGLIQVLRFRRFKDLPIPFIPFLVVGGVIAFVAGIGFDSILLIR